MILDNRHNSTNKTGALRFVNPKTSNFHNSGRKLPNLLINNMFKVPSIGLQYTLSFK